MEQAVRDTLKTFGAIDVLVNNAGHGYRGTIEESEPEAVRELFETNFFGPMELVRQVLPSMRARKRGMIINVTSIGAVRGALGNGYYSAAKGALELASEALAKEVQHLGIRVMLVEPGAFRTGFYGQRAAHLCLCGNQRRHCLLAVHGGLHQPDSGQWHGRRDSGV